MKEGATQGSEGGCDRLLVDIISASPGFVVEYQGRIEPLLLLVINHTWMKCSSCLFYILKQTEKSANHDLW